MVIGDTADFVAEQISNAVGTGDPEDQIVASLVLAAFVIATSSVGLVGTLILVPVVLIFFFIGVARLVPAIDDLWPLS